MNEYAMLLLSGGAGAALGLIFFAGLWWTVRRAGVAASPGLFFLASMLLRSAAVLGGFYLVGGAHWQRLLACLLGFTLARAVVLRATRPPAAESVHAP
ncbi:ATP synthase subunit I [Janthinobacterium sp.]|uniref:ATP synthase subunit I n=1 Tax=Janthinobacterium sp. TaxID=1871054 RepID=UPI00293D781A|nr:ATP synthase subunit I [Janthinobacterium sp.]